MCGKQGDIGSDLLASRPFFVPALCRPIRGFWELDRTIPSVHTLGYRLRPFWGRPSLAEAIVRIP